MKARLIGTLALALAAANVGVASAASSAPTLIDVHEIKAAAKNPAGPSGGANCANAGAATGAYVFTGWKVGGATTSTFNTTTLPANLNLSATVSAMQSAYSVWSQASPAPAITVTTSTTSALKPTANHRYELMFGRTGGTTLAVTYTWRWNDGTVESDTLFNTSVTWGNLGSEVDGFYETAGNVYDVGNIGTHEFGHTYGLDHPSAARFETMYAYGYSGETLKRSLASGDTAGANARY
jgi:hypothetical protein